MKSRKHRRLRRGELDADDRAEALWRRHMLTALALAIVAGIVYQCTGLKVPGSP